MITTILSFVAMQQAAECLVTDIKTCQQWVINTVEDLAERKTLEVKKRKQKRALAKAAQQAASDSQW
ncbi:hypothetical protein TETCHI1b_000148 [Candidatus Hodgkinia cicadicola]|nr:hypothetical protein TETCHI1b_000148 [Candidatus Hodgkinia cicadicola]